MLAISNISFKNKPCLAGTMSVTAAARLFHRFEEVAYFFNSLMYWGYIMINVPTVWLHKVSQPSQLLTYWVTQRSKISKSSG